ncbi:43kDa postsynaptic protein [Trema orientale]|uniref:RING-type E3 ubiquitin transferase n=1 Tax=Trema orientale TaxID=63057 RepID=A0A2P5F2U5_TREOI|nr:43kDa postsynaptic protein [Trema orientale]
MGGCCCSSRKAHLHGTPVYYYCPPPLEQQESLTSHNDLQSELTAGLLVHLQLDTSTPDTYQPPPAPLPYDVVFGCLGSTDSESSREETISCSSFKTSATCVDLEESDCKANGNSLDVSSKMLEISKPHELNVLPKEEEDCCPICLEGAIRSLPFGTSARTGTFLMIHKFLHADYDAENPKFVMKCEHYFHLSCILEWMERSYACPICDQEMVLDQTSN